jgi:archaeosine synthase
MLDVTSRDHAGRRATWETPQGEAELPAVIHPHTDRHPAPEGAQLALAREHLEGTPTVTYTGSALDPAGEAAPAGEDPLSVPRALVYPGSVDASLQRAADEATPEGPVRVAHDVRELDPHDGLVVLPTARRVADDPWRLAGFLTTARENAGPNAVLYTPGLGRPDQLALAALAGVDLFDGMTPLLAGLRGDYLTDEGPLEADALEEPPCPCPACHAGELARPALVEHNRNAAEAEARRVRHALEAGGLRELAEARQASPENVATLRRFDEDHAGFFEARAPTARTTELPVLGEASLRRPEVRRWLDRLDARYAPPDSSRVLVALPCSATKPYQNSPTHQAIRPAVEGPGHGRAHVVTLTSPLGAVPEELELAYPAAHYDVPVTGDWSQAEAELVRQAYRRVWKAGDYDAALLHLAPEEADLVEPVLPEATRTVEPGERPTDGSATDRLHDAVAEATSDLEPQPRRELFREHMAGRVAWQFGPDVPETMMEGTEIRGRYPYLKLMHGDTQLLMLKPERGALTLTLDGGRRLFEATDRFTVEIDDFHPKGDVFAPGVLDASEGIRVEDEVVVAHDGELRGVGRANAPGPEMPAMEHGSCAQVRHHA